ncbi:MAG: hypothetical protein M3Y12_10080 [Bacteroidota bacterium]|nr:hypothetical protein [Bacteroidota bacterium]
MKESIVNKLLEFSKTHDLLRATIEHGRICLANWMAESPEEHSRLFSTLLPFNFTFDSVSQELLFVDCAHETFILRTKYLLFTDDNGHCQVGWYALDVDQHGSAVDDWLIFS